MDQSWKAFERRVAKRVGGRRIPVTGERDGADVVAAPFVYQTKLRRGVPSYLREWLRGIVAAGERCGSTGVVVWKQPGALDDDAVVVLRLRDWQDWHGCETLQNEKPVGSESDGPVDYVHDFVHGAKPENGGKKNHLERTARLGSSATGYLVNSTPKEIYDEVRTLKEPVPSR